MEKRITELEIKLAFQEDLVAALNDRIVNQENSISALNLKIQHLFDKIQALEDAGLSDNQEAQEVPPHY